MAGRHHLTLELSMFSPDAHPRNDDERDHDDDNGEANDDNDHDYQCLCTPQFTVHIAHVCIQDAVLLQRGPRDALYISNFEV